MGSGSRVRLIAAALALSLTAATAHAQAITEIIDSSGDGVRGLVWAAGLAVDPSRNVWVSGYGGRYNVFELAENGAITEIIYSTGDGLNGLTSPQAIALHSGGNLYVSGAGSNNVFEITPGGTITQIIDSNGDGLGNTLNGPHDVAVDPGGNVFVSAPTMDGGCTCNIFKIAPGGTVTEFVPALGWWPTAITTDAGGNVYFTSSNSNSAYAVTPDGNTVTQLIDAAGDGSGNTLDRPEGIAVDAFGNVYVSGILSGNVFRIVTHDVPSLSLLQGALGAVMLLATAFGALQRSRTPPGRLELGIADVTLNGPGRFSARDAVATHRRPG